MADTNVRKQLEDAIARKSQQVPMSLEERGWVVSNEMEALIDAWYDLVDYYQNNNDDPSISVEVLAHYLHPTRLSRKLLLFDSNLNDAEKESIEEALAYFELSLDKIIIEVGSFLNQQD